MSMPNMLRGIAVLKTPEQNLGRDFEQYCVAFAAILGSNTYDFKKLCRTKKYGIVLTELIVILAYALIAIMCSISFHFQ